MFSKQTNARTEIRIKIGDVFLFRLGTNGQKFKLLGITGTNKEGHFNWEYLQSDGTWTIRGNLATAIGFETEEEAIILCESFGINPTRIEFVPNFFILSMLGILTGH